MHAPPDPQMRRSATGQSDGSDHNFKTAGEPQKYSNSKCKSRTIRAELVGSETANAEGITARGVSPIFGLCRKLVEAGQDPDRPLEAFRGDVMCIRVRSIGEAAKLVVRENQRTGPYLAKWSPFDSDARRSHRGRQPAAQNPQALAQGPDSTKESPGGHLPALKR